MFRTKFGGKRGNRSGYSLDDMANDYIQFFNTLGYEKVHLIGYGNVDIIYYLILSPRHFSRASQLSTTPHAPSDVLCAERCMLGVDWRLRFDGVPDTRLQGTRWGR